MVRIGATRIPVAMCFCEKQCNAAENRIATTVPAKKFWIDRRSG